MLREMSLKLDKSHHSQSILLHNLHLLLDLILILIVDIVDIFGEEKNTAPCVLVR